jgi:hypothetical protein
LARGFDKNVENRLQIAPPPGVNPFHIDGSGGVCKDAGASKNPRRGDAMSWRKWMRQAMTGLLLLLSVPAIANAFQSVRTLPRERADYYPWISFLSKGPAEKRSIEEGPLAYYRAYRVVVVQDPQQPLVFLEETVGGENGCCVRLASVAELDLVQLYEAFGLPEGGSEFRFTAWQSASAFTFSIGRRQFLLTGMGNLRVRIEERQPVRQP